MGTGFGGGQVKPRAIASHAVEPITDIVAHGSGGELERSVLNDVLRHAPLALLIVDHADRICFANDAAALLLCRSTDELRHAPLHHHIALHQRDASLGHDGGSSAFRCAAWNPETLNATLNDGRTAQAKFSAIRDRYGKLTHASIALEPITTQPEDATLDLLGRLSGELAHDINNHLSAALNYVFILRRRLASEAVGDHLEELQAAIWRASGLTSTLKILGGKRGAGAERLHAGTTLRALEPLLRHVARDVRVQMRLGRDLPEINAQRAYFEQVVITLALLLLARAPTDSVLRVTLQTTNTPEVKARISMELIADGERTNTRRSANGHRTHSGLRRALKRCGARLGHDARRVWVDFK